MFDSFSIWLVTLIKGSKRCNQPVCENAAKLDFGRRKPCDAVFLFAYIPTETAECRHRAKLGGLRSHTIAGRLLAKNVVLFSKDSLAEGENRVEGLQIARQFLLAWRALNYFTDCFRQNEEEKNV